MIEMMPDPGADDGPDSASDLGPDDAHAGGKQEALSNVAIRERLDALIRDSGDAYAAVSRLIGRNPAYIQQFIRRGVPRRLSETDRRLLARHFGVSESALGGPGGEHAQISPHPVAGQVVAIAPLNADRGPDLLIDRRLLDRLTTAHASLAALDIDSDSMAPTLVAGDRILIDRADNRAPRDGIYVIGSDGGMLVKRLSVHPVTGRVAILADNPAYPDFADCDPAAIPLVGRVVWVGRLLR